MDPSPDDLLFGRLALHYKLITRSQLEEVSGLLALAGGRRQLRDILGEMGYLTPTQVEQLLYVQREYASRQEAKQRAPGAPPASPTALASSGNTVLPAIAPGGGTNLAPLVPNPTAAERSAPPPAAAAGTIGTSWRNADRKLDSLLTYAMSIGVSDIHIHTGVPLAFRISGELRPMDDEPISAGLSAEIVGGLLDDEQREILRARGQIDLAYSLPGKGRFRINVFRQQRGLDVVMRAIPLEPPTLAQLGLSQSLSRLTDFHQGMVLITGPAGSGKSSTLAALVRILNETRRDHIITIEDPIEYLHSSLSCVVNQREVGRHTGSFAGALRAALREDPDIIAIGELRDLETISLAITAAETGHLVLGTIHTNSTIRTVNRILSAFPANLQEQIRTMLSGSLRAVVSQRLVRRADGNGRVPALEILYATRPVANLIRENKTFQIRSVLQTGAAHGMIQLDAALSDLVRKRVITREEALRHAEDPTKIATI